jgi:hypothetical protein
MLSRFMEFIDGNEQDVWLFALLVPLAGVLSLARRAEHPQ